MKPSVAVTRDVTDGEKNNSGESQDAMRYQRMIEINICPIHQQVRGNMLSVFISYSLKRPICVMFIDNCVKAW